MINFEIGQLFPAFLLNDTNGYAMAKALEAGLAYMLHVCQTGMDTLQNVEKMPEWRLDEMADELNCLYDYNANLEAKRHWIRFATPYFYAYGTPQAIYNYLEGYFDEVELEEYWQFDGDPFHFRVIVSGTWTDELEAWARKAIAVAKNARSVFDGLGMSTQTRINVHGEGELLARFQYPLTGDSLLCGTWPEM